MPIGPDIVAVSLRHGRALVYARPGREGSIGVRLYREGGSVRINVPCPPAAWPLASDDDGPILSVREIGRRRILAVTLGEESGVYGYRRVEFYELTSTGIVHLQLPSCEFSDYGSWDWTANGIALWDYLYLPNRESHAGPHRFCLTEWKLSGAHFARSRVLKTAGRYNPYDSGRPVPAAEDPLREWGSKWKTWGEPGNLIIPTRRRAHGS